MELILRALIQMQPAGPEDYATIAGTMAFLEAIIKVAPRVGQYLMVKLYAIADSLFMQDVCDAIELWLTEQGSSELAAIIRSLGDKEQDELLKRRMLEWVDGMTRTTGTLWTSASRKSNHGLAFQ